jgi:hypothetical protein
MAGEWQQHQLWDGTYILDDLLDWYEMAEARNENKSRFHEAVNKSREGHHGR